KDQKEPNPPILTRTPPRSRTGRHPRAPDGLQHRPATRLFEASTWVPRTVDSARLTDTARDDPLLGILSGAEPGAWTAFLDTELMP
uniref:hypothetical protein n=1 Tax=Roseomonas rosulenta TaxID=2748667 RepID=UPI001E299D4B